MRELRSRTHRVNAGPLRRAPAGIRVFTSTLIPMPSAVTSAPSAPAFPVVPSRIAVMPDALAARVAAGEVVERPASVVKELVENSLDAGASRIDVEIEGGGLRLIRVVDDGHGIVQGDLALAFARFATSKLGDGSDLLAIPTLGFRGEALPSIASVADVTARTRFVGYDHGFECNVAFGSEPQVLPAGAPFGTSVTVRQLFKNVPARRKFLGSEAAEAARVASVVSQLALVRPDVRFRLVANGSQRVDTPGDFKDTSAMSAVYGATYADDLVPLNPVPNAAFSAGGAVALPSVNFGRRSHITIAVNGRLVMSNRLSYAVERGFQGWLPDRRFPMALIKVSAPLDEVDVNVHPGKAEVRFRREGLVFSVIEKAVSGVLSEHAPVREFSSSRIATPDAESLTEAFARRRLERLRAEHFSDLNRTGMGDVSESEVAATDESDNGHARAKDDGDGRPNRRTRARERHADVLPSLRVLGQAQLTYIVAEDAQGVFLIDQHAAHERVKYEEMSAPDYEQSTAAQPLLKPHAAILSSQQLVAFSEASEWLIKSGWDVDPFGGDSVLVRAVPQSLAATVADSSEAAESALKRLLDEVSEDSAKPGRASNLPFADRILATMACHAAVRAGDRLTQSECEEIVRMLAECEQPQSCPHGRPTMLMLSGEALEREFGRRN